MKYVSTRGGVAGITFEDTLYLGFASDGGMLLPESLPNITLDKLKSWKDLSYVELAKEIFPYFIPHEEIPKADLFGLIDRAFSKIMHPEVITVKKFKNGLNILEMFHGKTLSFKDYGLLCVGQFLEYFLSKRRKHLSLIVATSGDTGSAAIEAVRGLEWVDIVVLLPKGLISETQELMMTTVLDKNIHVVRIEGGTIDDCDVIMKACLMDNDFREKHNLSSINSINWVRLMVQIVHYFFAYFQLCPECDEELEVIIPTGGCGNVSGGVIAYKMGLPVKFVTAVSQDIVSRTVKSGRFSKDLTRNTLAPSMDIRVPYNLQRVFYLMSNGDYNSVKSVMDDFERIGAVELPVEMHKKVQEIIVDAYVADDEMIKKTIKYVWENYDYVLCPHTAIGVAYYLNKNQDESINKSIVIATASPSKFKETVELAGVTGYTVGEEITVLSKKPVRFQDFKCDSGIESVRKHIEDIHSKINSAEHATICYSKM